MSYLDFPRLHFSGLFYTGPSTINNITQNYTPSVNLELPSPPAPPDQFNMGDTGAPGQAGWNPNGAAQWWLEECTVLSAVGSGGTDAASDAVIGALVQSPSPKTPMSDGKDGFYDIAKMVDLDPDQQGRSAIFGLRISVTLANGAGVQGLMTVPELRQLNERIPVHLGSWTAVGNWMGTLQDVQWSGDISGSPVLTALKAASAQGLAVKLTVDLHQNCPQNTFTAGDIFCYGRVLGTIGPALAGELSQVVPGRCVQQFIPAQPLAAPPPVAAAALSGRDRVIAKTKALSEAREAIRAKKSGALATAAPDPWNAAFAVVRQAGSQNLLNIDIGASIFLNAAKSSTNPSGFVSDGTFEVDSGIKVGVFNLAKKQFVPFQKGDINIKPQYQKLASALKQCALLKNSGVFTIPLTAADGTAYQTNPLAIQVNGTTVAQENANGLWMDVDVSAQRLQCGGTAGQGQIMVRTFGNPLVGAQPPVTSTVQLYQWILKNGQWTNPSTFPTSTDVGITIGKTDANGLAKIAVTVKTKDITLPAIRQPLDSQIYLIQLQDASGTVIGDIANAPISVLLFKAYQVPANPSWNDVGPIFSSYARLYPGMKARLDISDEPTVLGFATGILGHMTRPITDPAHMPVTRDLSPTKTQMIVAWLTKVAKQQSGAGS